MNELYRVIEKKIKASGYPRAISGEAVYDDIATRLKEKKMECIFYCLSSRKMLF